MSRPNPAVGRPAEPRVELRDDLSLLADAAGRVLLQTSDGARWLVGLEPDDVRCIFPVIAEKGRPGAICNALASHYESESILRLLRQLDGVACSAAKPERGERNPARKLPRVLITGTSALAMRIEEGLRGTGAGRAFELDHRPGSWAAASSSADVLFTTRPGAQDDAACFNADDVACVDLLVHVSTGTTVQALLDVERACLGAGVAVLFVTGCGGGIELGPALLTAGDAGPACVRIQVDLGSLPDGDDARSAVPSWWLGAADLPADLVAVAAREVGVEVASLLASGARARTSGAVAQIRSGEPTRWTPIARECPPVDVDTSVESQGRLALQRDLRVACRPLDALRYSVSAQERPDDGYRRIGILGGGTAGYLTALALRARRPELEVTLIESSSIPVIGVGEATTSEMPPFLHRILGFDVHDFTRRVRPTWKLGIRFEWGLPHGSHFNYPFDSGPVAECQHYDGHIRDVSLLSALMDRGKGLLLDSGDGGYASLLSDLPFAYHLENRRFVAYLQDQARRRGVRHIDCVVADAELGEDGETVEALIAEDGRRFDFDLYVDCSGFRSMLMGQKLGSPFVDYKSALFADTALVAEVPHGGRLKPYTTAESMDHGWCWSIPQDESDHRGYVFSSSFATPDQAVEEMRRKNPAMGDPWTVRFRSGRRESFFKGNVVAMGNAYGFVEPLESTALQVLVQEIMTVVNHLPTHGGARAVKRAMNRSVARRWDYIRDFLAVHYRFNQRADTPFWRACRDSVDLGDAAGVLELYRQGAPLSYQSFGQQVSRDLGGLNFNNFGFDVLLYGQGVGAGHSLPLRLDRDAHGRRRRALSAIAGRALPHRRCLEILEGERPDLLDRWVGGADGWLTAFTHELLSL